MYVWWIVIGLINLFSCDKIFINELGIIKAKNLVRDMTMMRSFEMKSGFMNKKNKALGFDHIVYLL